MATVKFNKELKNELSTALARREMLVDTLFRAEDAAFSAKNDVLNIETHIFELQRDLLSE